VGILAVAELRGVAGRRPTRFSIVGAVNVKAAGVAQAVAR
jgi:hypothetical protein